MPGALIPAIKWSTSSLTGEVSPGAKLYFYLSGTDTPQAVYADSSLVTPRSNPLVADADGVFATFYTAAVAYRVLLTDSAGATLIAATDNIYDFGQTQFSGTTGASLIGFIQAGSGAVARTVQQELRQTVSVQQFGATGDGVANDTSAIQQAINHVESLGGGIVELFAGTFSISQITLGDNVTLRGVGKEVSTLVKRAGTTSAMIVGEDTTNGNSWIVIEKLSINGNRAAIEGGIVGDGSAMGLRMDRWSYCTVRDVNIYDCATDGIYLGTTANDRTHFCQYIKIDRIDISNSRRNNLSILSAMQCWFTDSVFREADGVDPEAGIDIEPDSAFGRVEDLHFVRCVARDNDGDGFLVFIDNVSIEQTRITFDNCDAIDNGNRGFDFGRVDDDADGGYVRVVNCSATGNSGAGLLAMNKSINGPRFIVSNLYVKDNANGTINDGGSTTRAQVKLYAAGTAGLTTTPGGVDLLDIRGENSSGTQDKVLVSITGNVNWSSVNLRNLTYTNSAGTEGVWGFGTNLGLIGILGELDTQYRTVALTANYSVLVSDHGSILTNTGAAGTIVLTLPTAPARTTTYLRYEFRGMAAQQITIQPQATDQIMALTVAANTPVDNGGITGTVLVLENGLANQWVVTRNSGFAP